MSDSSRSLDREPAFEDLIEAHGEDCYNVGFHDADRRHLESDKARDAREKSYGALRDFILALESENERLKEDAELLDWVDTLPSGACILGNAAHPQSMCMTPKAQGFSHTRQLIRDARKSRSATSEETS